MKFLKTNRRQDQLGRRLREAATGGAPEFSEVLHAKIMAGIRHESGVNRTGGIFPGGRYWVALRLLAAAAVLLLIVGIWWFSAGFPKKMSGSYPSRRASAVMGSGGAEALSPGWLIGTLVQLPREQLERSRYAYLNKDVWNLASFLAGELDIAPHTRKPHRRKLGIRTRKLLGRRADG